MSHNPTRPGVTGRTKQQHHQRMSAYTLIIIGTGQHHLGHNTGNPDRDADHQLKQVVAKLQATGQTIHAAAFVVNGVPEMLAGKPEDLPMLQTGGNEEKGVTLEMVNANVERVLNLLSADKQPAPEAPKQRRTRASQQPEKKEGGGGDDANAQVVNASTTAAPEPEPEPMVAAEPDAKQPPADAQEAPE